MARLTHRSRIAVLLAATIIMSGCSNAVKSGGLPRDALHDAIAARVGDPSTCVLLADRLTGKVVYRYGEEFNCVRGLPACDRAGSLSATQAVDLARRFNARATSCPTSEDGSRQVGWAQGRVQSRARDLVYSAVMEGQRALPGQEISARLDEAFARAGL